MLKIIDSAHNISLTQLLHVYSESAGDYFYEDVLDFLSENGSMYAVWVVNGEYVSALRWQRYSDGFLVAGLETRPDYRNKGYAQCLLRAVVEHFRFDGTKRVYSHIHRGNLLSEKLHCNCGFEIINDYARMLDGSVSSQYNTLLIQI